MKYKKDSEGNDLLDEQGNPIPEENANPSGDETITPEEAKELKEALKNVVEEVKDLRVKNRELSEKIKPETPPVVPPVDDVTEKIKQVLAQEKMSSAEANKKAALEKFITNNKEFHPDNDITGLKRKALEDKLSRFNLSGMYSEEEFVGVFEEANLLLKRNDNSSKASMEQNPYSATPISKVTPPKVDTELSPKEKILVERGSATKEQILKLRLEKPSYLASILERVRD